MGFYARVRWIELELRELSKWVTSHGRVTFPSPGPVAPPARVERGGGRTKMIGGKSLNFFFFSNLTSSKHSYLRKFQIQIQSVVAYSALNASNKTANVGEGLGTNASFVQLVILTYWCTTMQGMGSNPISTINKHFRNFRMFLQCWWPVIYSHFEKVD